MTPETVSRAGGGARLYALVTAAIALAAAMFGFPAGFALLGGPLGGALASLGAASLAVWAFRRSGGTVDPAACSRGLQILSALATVGALVQIFRLTVFMVDPTATAFSVVPSSQWELRHNCVTAYYVAAGVADTPVGPFDEVHYTSPLDKPGQRRLPLQLGPFDIDVYEYPPQFLLLPRALRLVAPDFFAFRQLWFALAGGILLFVMVAVARSLPPDRGTVALLLAPLVWVALSTVSHLQKGNFQGAVITAAMLAMLLFARGRSVLGGFLLAFATVSKLYPGMLVVYLLAGRRWRDAAWTVAFGIVFSLATLADLGWTVYAQFLEHLPKLLSGEAFPAFRSPVAMAINYSVPGLVFKAKLFGATGVGFPLSKLVGWIFTVVILALTVRAARRSPRVELQPLVWLSILILASLRSPFLPQSYAPFPAFWLLTLLGALGPRKLRAVPILLAVFLALCLYWPSDWPLDPRWIALLVAVPQSSTLALPLVALRWVERDEERRAPA